MPSDATVSIITPCYRQAHWLAQAIASVRAQSYPAIQMVVVNDGSDDDTEEVVQRHPNRIHYIRQANRGLPAARNAGIRAAEGTYLLFLDADDLLHPDAVAWLVEAMEGREDRLCFVGYSFFEGDPVAGWQFDYLPRSNLCALLPDSFRCDPVLAERLPPPPPDHLSLLPFFLYTAFGPPHCVLCPRRMVADLGGFEEGFRYRGCEDWDLWLRLALMDAHVAAVPRIGAYYRRHPGSMSADVAQMLANRTEVLLAAHWRIVARPELRQRWGADLFLAERRVRRRYLALQRPSPLRGELSRAIQELRDYGVAAWEPRLFRTLDALLGENSERLALAYYRRFRPEILAYYQAHFD